MKNDFCYDIETYINMFSCCTVHIPTGTRWIHEVSPRIDQSQDFTTFIRWIAKFDQARMVGYNNEGFDYPVIHPLVNQGRFTAYDAYLTAQKLISADKDAKFGMMVWPDQRIVPQVDLYKIHHFDNPARATSLKALQIAMRSWSVIDLPYDPHTPLTSSQMDEIIEYNCHDVRETIKFYEHSKDKLEFREEVSRLYGFDATNFNDTKIGKEFFIAKLEEAQPGITGMRAKPKRPRQTHRPTICLNDVILPSIKFNHPEFNRILEFLKSTTITKTKGFFTDYDTFIYPNGQGVTIPKASKSELEFYIKQGARRIRSSDSKGKVACHVGGMDFIFGTGGIHGSRHGITLLADDNSDIKDVDVASYYPSLSIANRFFPAHLSELFCDLNEQLFHERNRVGKKTSPGATIKLGLNGTYGDSNNIYSCFFDPQYTIAITINGQLQLCMLAEWLSSIEGVELIQINTDGLTARVPKHQKSLFAERCKLWENHTRLQLESVDYKLMAIRDVNNYVARYADGSVKLKGAYDYNVGWHQNHSSLVIPKAVEAYLIKGVPVHETIYNNRDHFDFCRAIKVTRNGRLICSDNSVQQRVSRYHMAKQGHGLIRILPITGGPKDIPPHNEWVEIQKRKLDIAIEMKSITSKRGWRNDLESVRMNSQLTEELRVISKTSTQTRIDSGNPVKICNDIRDFDWSNLDYQWYIDQANELIAGVSG